MGIEEFWTCSVLENTEKEQPYTMTLSCISPVSHVVVCLLSMPFLSRTGKCDAHYRSGACRDMHPRSKPPFAACLLFDLFGVAHKK